MNKLASNTPAPDFLLMDLSGQEHRLSDYRGKVVVLNFWSAECPWSLRADQLIGMLRVEWGPQVVLLPIAPNANESQGMLAAVAQERELPLVLHDPQREVTDRYAAEMTPHIYVIDREGILRYQGAFDDTSFRNRVPTRNYLKEAVEALLSGKLPEVSAAPAYGCTIVYYPLEDLD